MKKYEGLFILNTAGKEEGVKELVDKISNEITTAGGKVENVQKMDKRAFSRVTDKKVPAGFYVNVIFEAAPASVTSIRTKLSLHEDLYRAIITEAAEPKAAPLAA